MTRRLTLTAILLPACLLLAVLAAPPVTIAAPADDDADEMPAARIVPGLAWKVARAHGVDEWETVESLSYTFHIPARGLKRRWTWEPHSNRVTYTGPVDGEERTVVYKRDAINTDRLKQIDHGFINDQYWLLFPFRIVWDSGVAVTADGEQDLPIGDGKAERLTVTYDGDDDNGYTPGDTYYVYVDDDGVMTHWSFKPGGADEIRVSTTFEDYAEYGPLKLAQRRATADGKFEILFEDIEIELADE